MSKLVVIFYSFLILIQSFNINIEDISKFNTLLDHANYHKEMYGDNFFKFLSDHYGEQMATHQDQHKDHENLPFKDHQHMLCHINTAFILTPQLISSLNQQSFKKIPLDFFYKEFISLYEKPSIFQPPKLA